jgi:hypothetical protein
VLEPSTHAQGVPEGAGPSPGCIASQHSLFEVSRLFRIESQREQSLPDPKRKILAFLFKIFLYPRLHNLPIYIVVDSLNRC